MTATTSRSVIAEAGRTYAYGSSLRAAPVAVTLERAGRVAEALGISRVTEVTRLDRIGIPVCVSVRPAAPKGSLCVNAGKGLTPDEARVGAAMEAIEFAMAEHGAADLPVLIATARDVLDGSKRPDSILDLCPRIGAEVPLDEPLACVEAEDVLGRDSCLVPAELVYLPSPRDLLKTRIFGSSSNGLSSGNTIAEATLHGLCEVIERDITSFNLMQDESRLVDPSSFPTAALEVQERIRAASLRLHVRTRLNPLGMPWFNATLIDPEHMTPLYVNGGYGCHPSRTIAMVRAITEAVQSRLSYIHGGRDDLVVRHDHVRTWTAEQTDRWVRQIISACADPEEMLSADDVADLSVGSDTIEGACRAVIDTLRDHGFPRICRVCYTRCADDLQVVRIIIPGMEYFSETSPRVGKRLRDYVQRLRA